MKLIFITQSTEGDHPTLGFTRDWVRALGARVDDLSVVCRAGAPCPGAQVRVCFAGGHDARQTSWLRRVRWGLHLRRHLGAGGDAVLAHMVPRDALAAARVLRGRVPLLLWYAHGSEDPHLAAALERIDALLTPTRGSCPIASAKVRILGHGVATERFLPAPWPRPPIVLFAARLAARKRPLFALRSFEKLVASQRGAPLELHIAGGALTRSDDALAQRLAAACREQPRVRLLGARRYEEMPALLAGASALLAPSLTASLDKVMLEAWACGLPVVAPAASYAELIAQVDPEAVPEGEGEEDYARALARLLALPAGEQSARSHRRRALVVQRHSLGRLARRIVEVAHELGA